MNPALSFTPARLWQSHPRETVALALLGCAAALAIAGVSGATPTLDRVPGADALPTSPSATELRDVAPEQAMVLNSQIPLVGGPFSAAPAFSMGKANRAARTQALECLTSAIYYEAGRESDAGQQAVAQVILNRVRHPVYPSSVCGVVYQGSIRQTGCQFTFTCDGSLARAPMRSEWNRARKAAQAALGGAVYAPAGLATHYHANYVLPYWAPTLVKTHVEGAHLFYRWSGNWGRPGAFTQRYAAREADAGLLRETTLAVLRNVTPVDATAETLDKVEGVEVAVASARVTANFDPRARAAVEAVKMVPYVDRVAASDNLRQALGGAAPQGVEAKPLGPAPDAKGTPAAPAAPPTPLRPGR